MSPSQVELSASWPDWQSREYNFYIEYQIVKESRGFIFQNTAFIQIMV